MQWNCRVLTGGFPRLTLNVPFNTVSFCIGENYTYSMHIHIALTPLHIYHHNQQPDDCLYWAPFNLSLEDLTVVQLLVRITYATIKILD